MKKFSVISTLVTGFLILVILTGCSGKKDIMTYVDVQFDGMDTKGTARYVVDEKKILKEVLNYDSESIPDSEMIEEIERLVGAYQIKLDKDENLSNGDTVKITIIVDENKTKKIKGGEKEFKVDGLEKPKVLSNKEIEKNVVINFVGVSGRGLAKIETTFESPLSALEFEVKNDGKLKNEDKVEVFLTKASENILTNNGYALSDDGKVTFEVTGLHDVAEKATDIANYEDLKRMLDEGIHRQYRDNEWFSKYEITQNKIYYRQFKKDTKDNYSSHISEDNGNLVAVYTIKEYSTGTDSKLRKQFTSVYGYSDIVLDDKREANVTEINEIEKQYDDTYSLESVLKLMEGYGYSSVD